MSARGDHRRLDELFAHLAAHGRFDGDEATEGGGGPVGGIGHVKGVHGKVDLDRSWKRGVVGAGDAAQLVKVQVARLRDATFVDARVGVKWLLPIRAVLK